jgi:hypothetical protein
MTLKLTEFMTLYTPNHAPEAMMSAAPANSAATAATFPLLSRPSGFSELLHFSTLSQRLKIKMLSAKAALRSHPGRTAQR